MSAPKPVIEVENVSKWYGDVVAVNGVSVQVSPGITGLLGPNGAGKTTLLHCQWRRQSGPCGRKIADIWRLDPASLPQR